jgi:lysophospholipase L1-like esterase
MQRLLIVPLCALLMSCGGVTAAPEPIPPAPQPRPPLLNSITSVYAVGDSIIEGHPHAHGRLHNGTAGLNTPNVYGQIPFALERDLATTVLNQGIGSQTCAQVRARWDRDVMGTAPGSTVSGPPAVLVLHCGINDLFTGRSAASIEADLGWMVEAGLSAGMAVVVDTIGPHGAYASANDARYQAGVRVNEWLRSTYGDRDLVIVARYDEFTRDPQAPYRVNRALMFDLVHPTQQALDQWGTSLAAQMRSRWLTPR